jgi:hypothetical protein
MNVVRRRKIGELRDINTRFRKRIDRVDLGGHTQPIVTLTRPIVDVSGRNNKNLRVNNSHTFQLTSNSALAFNIPEAERSVQDTKLVQPEAERSVGLPGRPINLADEFRINILTVQGVQLDLGSHDAKILQAKKCTGKEEGKESSDDAERKTLAPLLQP